ncbi:MAG: aspartate ammonia-lyase [Anaerolineaceae bacterium]|nr:aspartate ammonia-lyase [Anaerolineaceae bacterium]
MPDYSPATRSEKDSLGFVEVPENALYGAQTQRAVHNFPISGLKPWKAFIWSMVVIKRSAAVVNQQLGLLPEETAHAIQKAADEILAGQWQEFFVVDPFQAGAGTSHNMNTNEVLANRATQLLGGKLGEYLVHPNDHVNMAQSTNDVIPTAIRLGCLWRSEELFTAIDHLAQAINQKALEFDGVVKSGRTHLQDAVPVRLGQEFGAYATAISRDLEQLKFSTQRLGRLGIGGTATGSGLNAHPEYHQRMVSEIKQFTSLPVYPSDNLFESMQSMADMAHFSGAMRVLALTLSRIANDIRLLSSGPSTGLDEIRLPAVQPGSSIMPGKVNPVLAEMLNMAMFHVIGCDATIAMASQAGQLELNVMMPIIAHNLFEMMQVMIGSIQAFTEKCVVGIQANTQKTSFWLEKNAIVITALNPLIGYAAGASLVKEAVQKDQSVKIIALEHVSTGDLLNVTDGSPVTEQEIQNALKNISALTNGGIF